MARKLTKKDLLQTPIQPFEAAKALSVADLADAYKGMSFQARNLGTCMTVWERMLEDKDRPTIILGLAGSIMAGGLRKTVRDLINVGLVDVVVSTGALPYQDLYGARGHDFWRSSPDADDLLLREHMLDRLYDTLVDEDMFRDTDLHLGKLIGKLEPRSYTTREIYAYLGAQFDDKDSWVVAAARQGVPVFCPALNDSSLGIGMVANYVKAKKAGKAYPTIDPIRDAYELAQIKYRSKKTGVVYIGGGVSKNYIQQTEVIAEILGFNPGGHQYAIQLTTDAPHWGALSGCTFKEAQSWGKIAIDASFSQAHVDSTIGLPILTAALYQKEHLWRDRARLAFEWDGDGELLSMKPAKAGGKAPAAKPAKAPAKKAAKARAR